MGIVPLVFQDWGEAGPRKECKWGTLWNEPYGKGVILCTYVLMLEMGKGKGGSLGIYIPLRKEPGAKVPHKS